MAGGLVPALVDSQLIEARHLVEQKIYALQTHGEPWPPLPDRPHVHQDPIWWGGTDEARAELQRMAGYYAYDMTRGTASFWPASDAQRFINLIRKGTHHG